MLLNNPVDIFMPTPLYLLLLLVVLAVLAFRSPRLRVRRWRFPLLLAAAWCWLVSTPAFVHFLAAGIESRYPKIEAANLPHEPLIIVLAAGDPDEESLPAGDHLNTASLRRTIEAARLWRENGGSLIFTGTALRDERSAVSERMADLARDFGVPDKNILVETASLNTYENIRNSMALLEPAPRKFVLVTSALHMPRAMAVARQLGADAIAAPADFRARQQLAWTAWLPSSGTLPMLRLVLHEWVGLVVYRWRGWACSEDQCR